MKKQITLTILLIALLPFIGCENPASDDSGGDGNGGGDPNSSNRPSNIPYLDSVDQGFPDYTDSIVIQTIPQSDFSYLALNVTNFGGENQPVRGANYRYYSGSVLKSDSLTESQCADAYTYVVNDNWTGRSVAFISGGEIQQPWHTYAWLYKKGTTQILPNPEGYIMMTCDALLDNPFTVKPIYLQISRRYKKIVEVGVTDLTPYSHSWELETGTSLTEATEFTKTVGVEIEATAGASGGVFSAEVSASVSEEISTTIGTEISLTHSEGVTRQFSCNSPESGTVIYAVWQAIETYQYVDAEGNPWALDGFTTTSEMKMTNLTDTFIQTYDYF